MRRLQQSAPGFTEFLASCNQAATQSPELLRQVAAIIADVRAHGDAAVIEYTKKFDGNDAGASSMLVLNG